jgi:plasmid maintenance system antidote protein VapI
MDMNNHRYSGTELNRVLDAQGRRRAWLAAQLGVTVRYVHYVCRGERPLTPGMADRAASVLGVEPSIFLAAEFHGGTDLLQGADTA